jgi:hypothetical protein
LVQEAPYSSQADRTSTQQTAEPDTVTISLDNDLTGITSVTSDASNGDLELKPNGTGHVVINDTLTFSGMATDPTATSQTKVIQQDSRPGEARDCTSGTQTSGSGAVGRTDK